MGCTRAGKAAVNQITALCQITTRIPIASCNGGNGRFLCLPASLSKKKIQIDMFVLQVRCGCFYTTAIQKTGPSVRYLGPRFQNFLWIVSADGISSHVTLFTTQQPIGPSLKEVGSFSLVEVKVTSAEFSPGTQLRFEEEPGKEDKFSGDLVWLGTESRRYFNNKPLLFLAAAFIASPFHFFSIFRHVETAE